MRYLTPTIADSQVSVRNYEYIFIFLSLFRATLVITIESLLHYTHREFGWRRRICIGLRAYDTHSRTFTILRQHCLYCFDFHLLPHLGHPCFQPICGNNRLMARGLCYLVFRRLLYCREFFTESTDTPHTHSIVMA